MPVVISTTCEPTLRVTADPPEFFGAPGWFEAAGAAASAIFVQLRWFGPTSPATTLWLAGRADRVTAEFRRFDFCAADLRFCNGICHRLCAFVTAIEFGIEPAEAFIPTLSESRVLSIAISVRLSRLCGNGYCKVGLIIFPILGPIILSKRW